jgi:hypothetical protein
MATEHLSWNRWQVSTVRSPDTKKSSESSEKLQTEDKLRVSRCAKIRENQLNTRTHAQECFQVHLSENKHRRVAEDPKGLTDAKEEEIASFSWYQAAP